MVQRAVDELSGRRAVLHRCGARRRGHAAPRISACAFEPAIKAFIGQEATHRRIHALFNNHLAQQGLVNRWDARALRRLKKLEGVDLRIWVGATAATEHFTAILAEHLLSDRSSLVGAEPRLATLWLWHASEETEHRCTAFDLYRAMGGNEEWRLRLFRVVTWNFITDALRQTVNNLWHDGSFWRARTWLEGWRFLFGRHGIVRAVERALAALPARRLPSVAAGRSARHRVAARARVGVGAGGR